MQQWITKSHQFKKFWNCSVGFYSVWIAHLGKYFGLFDAIAAKPGSSTAISRRLKLHQPAVEIWASAAIAAGFLTSRGGMLFIPENAKKILLDTSSEEYLAGQFSYLALRSLDYGSMDSFFKRGVIVPATHDFQAIDSATEWDHICFIKNLASNSRARRMLERGCTFLDIGCGTGGLLEKLVNLYPNSTFEGVEPSKNAATISRFRLKHKGVKIRCLPGERIDDIEKFDIIFFGEVLFSLPNKKRILRAAYNALKHEGLLAIIEGLLPAANSRSNLENQLISQMQLDYALQGANFMDEKELLRLLRAEGFRGVKMTDLGGRLFLTTCTK